MIRTTPKQRTRRRQYIIGAYLLFFVLTLPVFIAFEKNQQTGTSRAAEIIPSISPRPTPAPKSSIQPMPSIYQAATPTPLPTKISITLGLHGLGSGGTNASASASGTYAPLHTERHVTVALTNERTIPQITMQGVVTYDQISGLYKGTFDPGKTFVSGSYRVQVKTDHYLTGSTPGLSLLSANKANIVPRISLMSGDSNNDAVVNILDYNMLLRCYRGPAVVTQCPSLYKTGVDITDDGVINGLDYQLFIRESYARKNQ